MCQIGTASVNIRAQITKRPKVESDIDHELEPRKIEIQKIRMQVKRRTQCLERLERSNHCEDYNEDMDAEEFINQFHGRSPMSRRRHMDCHEDTDHSLNIKLEILEYNDNMKGDGFI